MSVKRLLALEADMLAVGIGGLVLVIAIIIAFCLWRKRQSEKRHLRNKEAGNDRSVSVETEVDIPYTATPFMQKIRSHSLPNPPAEFSPPPPPPPMPEPLPPPPQLLQVPASPATLLAKDSDQGQGPSLTVTHLSDVVTVTPTDTASLASYLGAWTEPGGREDSGVDTSKRPNATTDTQI